MLRALDYMGLTPGAPLAGTKIDWVFIGSCANSRLSDLREAAQVVAGRRVAAGVCAWVVPGSEKTKRDAEAEGLHLTFLEAGFEWRSPGCSMCVAANGELLQPGQRSVSTSNRNFVGRQGTGCTYPLGQSGDGRRRGGGRPHYRRADAFGVGYLDMKPFTTLAAKAAPLMRANIDTDQIIRIDRLIAPPARRTRPILSGVVALPAQWQREP